VREKICSKEYYLVKQNLYKLETKEAKMSSNPTVVETANTLVVESLSLMAHLLPLANPFSFGSSFF